MKIVLDTNVVVSGLLQPFGPSGEIIRMVSAGALSVYFDTRIILEYEDVLARPKFHFNPNAVHDFLEFLKINGELVTGHPQKVALSDPNDEMFVEIAMAGSVDCLITGNIKHYLGANALGVKILSPKDFIEWYKKKR